MANHTPAPDDDYYDVLVDSDLYDNETLTKDEKEQCPPYDSHALLARLEPPLYSAVALAGLLHSLVVLFLLLKHKRLRLVENIYVLNLAVSNVCLLLALPIRAHAALHGGTLGHPLCVILVTLSSMGLHSEAFFSVLLTLQNYLVFFHVRSLSPAARKVPCGVVASGLAWLTAALLTLPEFLFFTSRGGGQRPTCLSSRPHFLPGQGTRWEHFLTLKLNMVAFLVPLLVFMVCFVRLRKTLRKSELSRLVFALVAVYLVMWGPYNIALFLSAFKASFSLHGCGSRHDLDRSVQVTRAVASTHCCVSPLLYLLLDTASRTRVCRLCRLGGDTPPRPPEDPAHDPPWDERDHSTQL